MSSVPRQALLPVLGLLLSATLWGVIWYPLRLLEQHGLQGLWTTLIMYAAATLVGVAVALPRRHEIPRHPWALTVIGLTNAWCNIAFILAVLEGNVVRVLLLFYLSPLWTVLLGWFMLDERPSRSAFVTLGVALVGALIMLWDPALGVPWPQSEADWLAISSGLSFAVSNVLVRKTQGVSVRLKSAVTWLGVALMAGLWVWAGGLPLPAAAPAAFVGAIALGLFGTVIMTAAVQYGVTHMPVHRSAVILLFELVAGAVSSQLLTDEVVLMREWIGGALIMVAAYFSARQPEEITPKTAGEKGATAP